MPYQYNIIHNQPQGRRFNGKNSTSTRRARAADEIVFGSADTRVSTAISRDVRGGRLRRITPKLYTTNLKDPPESIIRRHLYCILARYYPGAVVSHRSVLEGGAARNDTIFLTYLSRPQHTQGRGEQVLTKGQHLSAVV
ncbi:MAG: hypothetical protein ACYDB1_12765 [Acidiferrobacteraceae bacterium]